MSEAISSAIWGAVWLCGLGIGAAAIVAVVALITASRMDNRSVDE